jgi:SnoaL-like domain
MQLYQRFEQLWATRDPGLISSIVAADGRSYWSGLGAVAGRDYPERWNALVQSADALEFTVTGHAAEEPYLFISWHVRATVEDESVEYDGIDRFRLRGDLAEEVYVVFDTAPVRELLGRFGGPAAGSQTGAN